jgi:hypothetical protein
MAQGVGMRWRVAGFNPLLHLWLAWGNGTFEALVHLEDQGSSNTSVYPCSTVFLHEPRLIR